MRASSLLAVLVPAASAQSVQLSGPLPDLASDVIEFKVDPAQTHALYVADQDQVGVRELYSVPLDRSTPPLKLNAPFTATGDVTGFLIGSGGRVVYRADPSTDGAFALFGTNLDGSLPPVQLSGPMTPGGQPESFALSPDGAWLVYSADQDVDDLFELYAVPSDGSAPAHEVHTPQPEDGLFVFKIDPTSTNVLYNVRSNPQGAVLIHVYVTPLDGSSSPLQLAQIGNGSSLSNGISQIAFSPDGTWANFTAINEVSASAVITLYLVPVDGSSAARNVSGSTLGISPSLGTFTPDGQRVVFTRSFFPNSNPSQNLYSATLTDPRIALDTAEVGSVPFWRLDASGDTVFFAQASGVYRVPTDGSAPQTLLSPVVANSYLAFELAPDGSRVVFAVALANGSNELRSVPSAGGATVTLAQSPAGQPLRDVRLSPSSRYAVYEQRTNGTGYELFQVPLKGTHGALRVNDLLPPVATVQQGFALTSPTTAVYIASQNTSGVFELFANELVWKRWQPGPPGPIPFP